MTQRWTLYNPVTDESWEFPMNPNKMTSPHRPRTSTTFTRSATHALSATENFAGVARVLEAKQEPYEWEFSGVIRQESHYVDLFLWFQVPTIVHLTDHFQRTWRIRFESIDFNELRPTMRRPDRYEYTAKTLMYGEAA